MIREDKKQAVKRVEEWLSNCRLAIVTDYRGMTVSQMNELRRQLGESNTQYHVVKNSMAVIAAEATGRGELKGLLQGPSAIAFGYGDEAKTAKILTEYVRSAKAPLKIRGGVFDRRLLGSDDIAYLSTLPAREVLVSQLMQQLQSPISSLLAVLTANLAGIIGVLQARKQQLEGGLNK
ncbi:MAG: 50S ribosomal protein L10 [Chloroflexi bacterium RBG_13_54_8]|nr:MAG: 50S ribosomal protein L10 [Chloroflexi bacterium RBG_13_54_8]